MTITDFSIDADNTKADPGYFYTNKGTFTTPGVSGNLGSMVTNYECKTAGISRVDFFFNPKTSKLTEITLGDCATGFHLGGVLIECDDNSCNPKVLAILNPENKCVAYKRAFTSAFGSSFNLITETVNTCEDLEEFNNSFNCSFDIDSNVACIYGPIDGNIGWYDGLYGEYDGNIGVLT